MKIQLCPFKQKDTGPYYCDQEKCQWWTRAYTTEGIEIFDCAIVINAMKNSEGKIPV